MVLAAGEFEEVVARAFVAIAAVVIVARLMGALFRRIGQPPVVGEILGGILLGPTLLGAFPGDLTEKLFPDYTREQVLPFIAQLGLIIFMFIVGLELDVALIKGKERLAAGISVASVALPFALGFALASIIHDNHLVNETGGEIDFLPFALFMGASMSITAFPVLARILTDRGMHRTEIGALTLACAAVDDILAWSLLAVVIAIANPEHGDVSDLPVILGWSLVYVAAMFFVVKPQLARLGTRFRETGRLTSDMVAIVLIGILISSFITSEIGIHSIFGAFIFGVIMPRQDTGPLLHGILEKIEPLAVLLLLPVFFIVTGLAVDVRGLTLDDVGELAMILVVACVGKFVGARVSARAQGVKPRKATAIGILMNTRGLTELVILNVGLSFGVLDQELFTMLVIMALVTTAMAGPLLRVFYPDRVVERDVAEAELAASGGDVAFRVVVAFDDPVDTGPALVDLAIALAKDEPASEIQLLRYLPAQRLEIGTGLGAGLTAMTESLGAMRTLQTTVEDAGMRALVRSQYSDDIAGDVRVHASAIGVDAVVLGGSDPNGAAGAAEALFREAPANIVLVRNAAGLRLPGAGESVSVRMTGTNDTMAAVEVGVRLARAGGASLELADAGGRRGRRAAGLAENLGRVGVAATVSTPGGDGGGITLTTAALAITPADGTAVPSDPGLVVRGKEAAAEDSLDKLLQTIGAPMPAAEPGGDEVGADTAPS